MIGLYVYGFDRWVVSQWAFFRRCRQVFGASRSLFAKPLNRFGIYTSHSYQKNNFRYPQYVKGPCSILYLNAMPNIFYYYKLCLYLFYR